ncbi:hypothetical protein FGF1_03400 [Flavobacteriaceae bacterium GF1]
MADLSKYRFDRSFKNCPASEFKKKLKARYKGLSAKDIQTLTEREYGREEREKVEKLQDGNGTATKAKTGATGK